ncbi:MAG: GNAT family N-acetyltransferase [Lachnospiraceae bacterium]|nr:GNAT family N-acetyltransferase [Lachnospiraceae bacterium]
MKLRTERLILRPWTSADAEVLFRWAKDPQVGPIAGWPAHRSIEDSKAMIADQYSKPEVYAVCLCGEEAHPIGCLSLKFGEDTDLSDAADECEISAWLAPPYWGQGLIPEGCDALLGHGFEDLGMKAIWAGYYDGNFKSVACLMRIGFREHHIEKNIYLPLLGELRCGHVVVMTRADWEERQ